MVRIIGILILLNVAGCAYLFGVPSNTATPKIGNIVVGPYGWHDYCSRNRTDKDCLPLYPQPTEKKKDQ